MRCNIVNNIDQAFVPRYLVAFFKLFSKRGILTQQKKVNFAEDDSGWQRQVHLKMHRMEVCVTLG